jgi:hypothetical protein
MPIGYWWKGQKDRDRYENQDVGGWMIIRWILERGWSGLVWFRTGASGGL